MSDKIQPQHLTRKAMLYVRQSTAFQVTHNNESSKLQYAMQGRLRDLGFTEIEVIDEDLGRSAAGAVTRSGFERMVAEVSLGRVGAVAAREVSRFARNSREWQQLVEVCRIVDTVLIDQETVYSPQASNDRLLLGLKGSLNEYELDLLRQRSLEARRAMAQRGELLIIAPVGYRKTDEHRLEKDPDRRVQEAIRLVFDQFEHVGSVRQTLLWFHEHRLQLPATMRGGEIVWKRPIYGTRHQMLTNPIYGDAYAYGRTEHGTRYLNLSITHMLSAQKEAYLDIREPGHPAPDDGVAWRCVAGAIQVATEARQLRQAGFQRWSRGPLPAMAWSESIQKIDLQRREREGRSSIAGRAVDHGQPEDAPAQDAECGEQVDQTLGSAQLRLFSAAARFKDLVEEVSIFQRNAYQRSFSMASARELTGRSVMSFQSMRSRPRDLPRSVACNTVSSSAG